MAEAGNVGADAPAANRIVSTQQIEDAGMMMPLADPAALRAAFAERQRVLTSILDPNRDFVYSVKYVDRENKQRQLMVNTLKEAQEKSAFLEGHYTAHPKKSGVLKLAHALGIESRMVETTGLPKDTRANYSSCRYIATHKRTGRQEEGQGYCDKTERVNMQNHAIISMADTRAYCHAVLRCAGYDNVGAESMEGLDDADGAVVVIQNTMPQVRERPALSSQSSPRSLVDELKQAAPAPQGEPVAKTERTAPAAAAPQSPPPDEATTPSADAAIAGKGDVITNAMAAELSQLLLAKLGSKEKAREWLKDKAGVERSVHVRDDQLGSLKSMLNALEAP